MWIKIFKIRLAYVELRLTKNSTFLSCISSLKVIFNESKSIQVKYAQKVNKRDEFCQ